MPSRFYVALVITLVHGVMSSKIRDCCSFNSSTELMQCVREVSDEQLQHQLRNVPYLSNKLGPRLSIVQVTRATPNIFSYASRAVFLQSAYASHNGYGLYISTDEIVKDDYELYPKLALLLRVLKSEGQHSDFLVWADADVAYLDFDMRFEQVRLALLLQTLSIFLLFSDCSSASECPHHYLSRCQLPRKFWLFHCS